MPGAAWRRLLLDRGFRSELVQRVRLVELGVRLALGDFSRTREDHFDLRVGEPFSLEVVRNLIEIIPDTRRNRGDSLSIVIVLMRQFLHALGCDIPWVDSCLSCKISRPHRGTKLRQRSRIRRRSRALTMSLSQIFDDVGDPIAPAGRGRGCAMGRQALAGVFDLPGGQPW